MGSSIRRWVTPPEQAAPGGWGEGEVSRAFGENGQVVAVRGREVEVSTSYTRRLVVKCEAWGTDV